MTDKPEPASGSVELSIVLPCLNEGETLASCLQKAKTALRQAGIAGEVIVADNGSTDNSLEIARQAGARIVNVQAKGYGNALMGGIAAARGQYILMGDADDSYDFLEAPRFLEKLRQGHELVQGCRLPSGGGTIAPGAMPFSHRWLGNPMFSFMVRLMFAAPIHDVYCGMRGFSKALYDRLELRCTGMEFATEMIIKSSLRGAKFAEIPITLHPDGRIAHRPHLRTFRDGWRTLRFFLLCSPRWLFLNPGLALMALGALAYALALPGVKIGRAQLDVHTLLFGSLAILLGAQSVLFAIMAKTFAVNEGLLPEDPRLTRFFRVMNLERGLVIGGLTMLAGCGLLGWAIALWWQTGFGHLDYSRVMRWVIPGVTLTSLGFQGILASFFTSFLGLSRKLPPSYQAGNS